MMDKARPTLRGVSEGVAWGERACPLVFCVSTRPPGLLFGAHVLHGADCLQAPQSKYSLSGHKRPSATRRFREEAGPCYWLRGGDLLLLIAEIEFMRWISLFCQKPLGFGPRVAGVGGAVYSSLFGC